MNKGLYVAVEYTQQSASTINQYILKYIPNPVEVDDLHTTLIYSKTWDDVKIKDWELYPAVITGYEIWPSEYYKSNILVALLDSEKLTNRFNYLMKNYNLTYDFDSYKPHITLSKNVEKDYDFSKLTKNFTVIGANEYSEELHK